MSEWKSIQVQPVPQHGHLEAGIVDFLNQYFVLRIFYVAALSSQLICIVDILLDTPKVVNFLNHSFLLQGVE